MQDEEELEFGSTSTGSKLGLKMTQTIDIEIPKFKSKRTSLKPLFEVEDFNGKNQYVSVSSN